MAEYARRLIEEFNEVDGGAVGAMVLEPAFELADVRDEPRGDDFVVAPATRSPTNGRPTSWVGGRCRAKQNPAFVAKPVKTGFCCWCTPRDSNPEPID